MNFYQDLSESQKTAVRRWGLLFALFINIFLLALIVSYGFSAWQSFKAIRSEVELTISVSGEGKVSAKPDVAKITATILTENELLKIAQEENSRQSNVLIGYLKSQSVGEKDIKTIGYNIYPQYSYPPPCRTFPCPLESERPKIIGYQIRNSYGITIRDISQAGEILSGIVVAGANEVGGISFTIDDPEAFKAQARKKAIDIANEKAKTLAKDLGKRLGKIVNFSESASYPQPIYFAQAEAFGKGGGPEAPPAPSVEPGENEIVVNVSITYEFK